jgi:glycolate oxidase FAD binding subunit
MNSEHRYSATAFSPSTSEELRAFLVKNFGAAKRPLIAVGGGTSFELETHGAERRLKVATRGLDRVVEFAARDMTITVEAGIPIARLDEVLRGEGLRLPIDIPQWDRATLGGAVAADVSGPRRYGLGTFRDYVIGLAAMKADGQVFHSGGRVVKNVAGYDLCKLMVGSRGTLAILTQITLKLKPIPEASALVCAAFANVIDREAAVAGLLQSKTRPVALDSLNRAAIQGLESRLQLGIPAAGPALVVGYEGTQRETDWQIVTLLDELAVSRPLGLHALRNADAAPLWNAFTEFAVPTGDLPAFEVRLLPSKIAAFETGCDDLISPLPVELVARAANGSVFGRLTERPAAGSAVTHPSGGPQAVGQAAVDPRVIDSLLEEVAALATGAGGTLRVVHGKSRVTQDPPHSARTGNVRQLTQQLKAAFDPANLLPSP